MGRRRRRRADRRRAALVARLPLAAGTGHHVALALEARLLGLRLLRIDAVVDAADAPPGSLPAAAPAGGGATTAGRRRDVERLLAEAQASLGAARTGWSAPAPDASDRAQPRSVSSMICCP